MTDGLDGLAGGCAALAFMGMSIAVLPISPGKHATLKLITVYSSLRIYLELYPFPLLFSRTY